ncbi:DUF7344 domain-containing protein [Salinilacihabitans rarus]|uniref:DUF7344 domain-containing protein n=1 Tax=Salinilacihabitans rarus TaxID=2961596 RepID=UPI0020C8D768|nr:hypothetical protein [Salinilacihabitans rarus]
MPQPSNDTTGADPDRIDLTASTRYHLLAAERRRLTLDVLEGNTAPVDLDELAAGIAAREDGIDADESAVERVAIDLHHVHLPKMDDLGIVDYDPASGRVDPTGVTLDSLGPVDDRR